MSELKTPEPYADRHKWADFMQITQEAEQNTERLSVEMDATLQELLGNDPEVLEEVKKSVQIFVENALQNSFGLVSYEEIKNVLNESIQRQLLPLWGIYSDIKNANGSFNNIDWEKPENAKKIELALGLVKETNKQRTGWLGRTLDTSLNLLGAPIKGAGALLEKINLQNVKGFQGDPMVKNTFNASEGSDLGVNAIQLFMSGPLAKAIGYSTPLRGLAGSIAGYSVLTLGYLTSSLITHLAVSAEFSAKQKKQKIALLLVLGCLMVGRELTTITTSLSPLAETNSQITQVYISDQADVIQDRIVSSFQEAKRNNPKFIQLNKELGEAKNTNTKALDAVEVFRVGGKTKDPAYHSAIVAQRGYNIPALPSGVDDKIYGLIASGNYLDKDNKETAEYLKLIKQYEDSVKKAGKEPKISPQEFRRAREDSTEGQFKLKQAQYNNVIGRLQLIANWQSIVRSGGTPDFDRDLKEFNLETDPQMVKMKTNIQTLQAKSTGGDLSFIEIFAPYIIGDQQNLDELLSKVRDYNEVSLPEKLRYGWENRVIQVLKNSKDFADKLQKQNKDLSTMTDSDVRKAYLKEKSSEDIKHTFIRILKELVWIVTQSDVANVAAVNLVLDIFPLATAMILLFNPYYRNVLSSKEVQDEFRLLQDSMDDFNLRLTQLGNLAEDKFLATNNNAAIEPTLVTDRKDNFAGFLNSGIVKEFLKKQSRGGGIGAFSGMAARRSKDSYRDELETKATDVRQEIDLKNRRQLENTFKVIENKLLFFKDDFNKAYDTIKSLYEQNFGVSVGGTGNSARNALFNLVGSKRIMAGDVSDLGPLEVEYRDNMKELLVVYKELLDQYREDDSQEGLLILEKLHRKFDEDVKRVVDLYQRPERINTTLPLQNLTQGNYKTEVNKSNLVVGKTPEDIKTHTSLALIHLHSVFGSNYLEKIVKGVDGNKQFVVEQYKDTSGNNSYRIGDITDNDIAKALTDYNTNTANTDLGKKYFVATLTPDVYEKINGVLKQRQMIQSYNLPGNPIQYDRAEIYKLEQQNYKSREVLGGLDVEGYKIKIKAEVGLLDPVLDHNNKIYELFEANIRNVIIQSNAIVNNNNQIISNLRALRDKFGPIVHENRSQTFEKGQIQPFLFSPLDPNNPNPILTIEPPIIAKVWEVFDQLVKILETNEQAILLKPTEYAKFYGQANDKLKDLVKLQNGLPADIKKTLETIFENYRKESTQNNTSSTTPVNPGSLEQGKFDELEFSADKSKPYNELLDNIKKINTIYDGKEDAARARNEELEEKKHRNENSILVETKLVGPLLEAIQGKDGSGNSLVDMNNNPDASIYLHNLALQTQAIFSQIQSNPDFFSVLELIKKNKKLGDVKKVLNEKDINFIKLVIQLTHPKNTVLPISKIAIPSDPDASQDKIKKDRYMYRYAYLFHYITSDYRSDSTRLNSTNAINYINFALNQVK